MEVETEPMAMASEPFADSEMAMSEDGNLDAEMNLDQSQPTYQGQDDAQMENNDNEYHDGIINGNGLQEETIEIEIQPEAMGIENENENDANMSSLSSDPKEVEMQSNSSSPKFEPILPLSEQTQCDQVAQDFPHPPQSTNPDPQPETSNLDGNISADQEFNAATASAAENEAVEKEYGEGTGGEGEAEAQQVEESTQDEQSVPEDTQQGINGTVEESENPQAEALVNQTEAGEEVEQSNSVDETVPSIRVSFNGQDFVLYPSSSSSSSYLGLDLSTDPNSEEEINQQQQSTIEVSAPPLRAPGHTFHSPLETLFESLRVKDVLGDFLEEGTEIVMWLPELELTVREVSSSRAILMMEKRWMYAHTFGRGLGLRDCLIVGIELVCY